jgi:5'-deoxynucleotidase YfbR-like HD superfamily hydrolase
MAWALGRETNLNLEKLLKMALCHEISAVYTGDSTPYDRILPKDRKARGEILKKMVRLSREKKAEIFFKDYHQEKKTLERLTSKLSPSFRDEIIHLWKEYRTKSSPEGRFLSQLNVSAVLLQTLLYEKEDNNFFAAPIWEWAFENVDHPQILLLLKEMKSRFYGS